MQLRPISTEDDLEQLLVLLQNSGYPGIPNDRRQALEALRTSIIYGLGVWDGYELTAAAWLHTKNDVDFCLDSHKRKVFPRALVRGISEAAFDNLKLESVLALRQRGSVKNLVKLGFEPLNNNWFILKKENRRL